jgi:hypothetical protein
LILQHDDVDPKKDCEAGHGVEYDDEVDLTERLLIRDVRFDSIVRSCKNLKTLDLGGCLSVTDESLKSLGASKSITQLILTGCMITDLGLEYLANGDLKNCLKSLFLDECDRISDVGFSYLKQMVILHHLVLSNCGVLNIDSGTLAISQIPNINTLHLLWSTNITDISLSHIALPSFVFVLFSLPFARLPLRSCLGLFVLAFLSLFLLRCFAHWFMSPMSFVPLVGFMPFYLLPSLLCLLALIVLPLVF